MSACSLNASRDFISDVFARTPKQQTNNTPVNTPKNTQADSVDSQDVLIVLSNPFKNDPDYKKQAQSIYNQALEIMQNNFGAIIQSRPRVNFCVERFCDFGLLHEMSQWKGDNLTIDLDQYSAAAIVRAWVPQELDVYFELKKRDFIPFWFKTGLAMTLANDPRYALSAYSNFNPRDFRVDPVEERKPPFERDKTRLTVDVTDLNSRVEWNSAIRKFRKFNDPVVHLLALKEVQDWFQYAGSAGIIRLITEVNQGADFMLVYENIRDIGLNK